MNQVQYDLVEDLALLPHLNESSALHTLQQRYYRNLIHTYAGKKTLLVVNPVRPVSVYTEKVCNYWRIQKVEIRQEQMSALTYDHMQAIEWCQFR